MIENFNPKELLKSEKDQNIITILYENGIRKRIIDG